MKNLVNDKDAPRNSIPFSFAAPAARSVSLAGDFNDWDPDTMPMYKGSNGVWYLTISLLPGLHEYRFVADGIWKDDPTAQRKVANAMGSENCVRTVDGEIMSRQTPPQDPSIPGGITL